MEMEAHSTPYESNIEKANGGSRKATKGPILRVCITFSLP